MSGTGEWDSTIDRLVAATNDAREVIQEAHGVTRDLRQLITESRKLFADGAEEAMQERLGTAVKKAVEELGTATEKAMRLAVERVDKKFDELAALYTGTERGQRRRGEPPLEDLIRAAAALPPALRGRARLPRKTP